MTRTEPDIPTAIGASDTPADFTAVRAMAGGGRQREGLDCAEPAAMATARQPFAHGAREAGGAEGDQ